jgi:outer membrane receptor protein involved in Fe transport
VKRLFEFANIKLLPLSMVLMCLPVQGQSINESTESPSSDLIVAQPFDVAQGYSLVSGESNPRTDKWYERSFEQLLEMEIVTATRGSKAITAAPSVVTVYTADDIQRMGARTVEELLERTPGFFFSKQTAGPVIGSRGYVGDNEQFLLLIDGHSVNSIVDKGPGYFFMFPILENVKRVEIIRGPGSTLWGSDAALGVIHLITKDGADIAGSAVTVSAPLDTGSVGYDEDGFRYLNFQTGERLSDDVEYMMSFMYTASDGYPIADPSIPNGRWEQIDDSWELYAKARLRDVTIRARMIDFKNSRPGKSIGKGVDESAFSRRRDSYVDVERIFEVSSNYSIETRFFSGLMQRWQELMNLITTPSATVISDSAASKESSLGFEIINRLNVGHHTLTYGARAVRTEIDPVTEVVTYPIIRDPTEESSDATLNLRVVPEDVDNNYAVFFEDDWSLIEDQLDLVFGIRFDRNTLREDNLIVLPRIALNWSISEQIRAMYAYNTGYIRPPAGIGFLGQRQYSSFYEHWIYGAQDSEQVNTHDLQFSFDYKPVSTSLTLYQMSIDDSFNFLFENGTVDGEKRALYFVNTNRIKTYGFEFELQAILPHGLEVYGNYSEVLYAEVNDFTDSTAGIDVNYNSTAFKVAIFTPEGRVAGAPHKTWNLGVNYSFSQQGVLNLHWRGWRDMEQRVLGDFSKVKTYGPENFVDLNVRMDRVFGLPVAGSFYVKNLFDNDDSEIAMPVFSNNWSEPGRIVGIAARYQF